MKTIAKISTALVLSVLAIAHGAYPVGAEQRGLRVKPLNGIALTVGPKRAIGYYVARDGICNLTLMIADAYSDDAAIGKAEPVRVTASIPEMTTASIETMAGSALAFGCGEGAATMRVQPVERLAYVPAAQ